MPGHHWVAFLTRAKGEDGETRRRTNGRNERKNHSGSPPYIPHMDIKCGLTIAHCPISPPRFLPEISTSGAVRQALPKRSAVLTEELKD
ncbi:putative kynurenine--oxoglutarate transaminase BNA3 [Dissostichus eleginoides]|uniref:Kynurenine--oxoglutarate transaminase BNA3 n=1 Tax=Dissostichus eleginoides TaxID=100907 RepID=A0AAD9EXX6_DISEL|nr:putative kynurenine--oxoglutarate transaminase BNA3 [Dissostichus eleginoides]